MSNGGKPARRVRRPGAAIRDQFPEYGIPSRPRPIAAVVDNLAFWQNPDSKLIAPIPASDEWLEAGLRFTGAWIVVDCTDDDIEPKGHVSWREGRIWIHTVTPTQAHRYKAKERLWRRDFETALAIYRGDKWWPPLVKSVTNTARQPRELEYALEHQGWALVYSRRLEDEIVVVRDTEVVVPVKYGKRIRYTLEELVRIGELGKGARLSLGELSAIHLVKSLGGTVVQ